MEKHEWVELLRSDVDAFNSAHRAWQEENPWQRLDLRGVDLRGVDLSGADLRGVDLSGADLRDADLRRSNLSGADLRRADLSGADLRHANLLGADLRRSSLRHANLLGADLRRSSLRDADLRGAKAIWRIEGMDNRGYALISVAWEDGMRFGAGCHWFTELEALVHWGGEHYPDKARGQRYVAAVKLLAGFV